MKKIVGIIISVICFKIYASDLENKYVICVNKNDRSNLYHPKDNTNPFVVEGRQSYGYCTASSKIYKLFKNYFVIDNESFEKVKQVCLDNYFAQPVDGEEGVWYRFATISRDLNKIYYLPGYHNCELDTDSTKK